ncbi:nuclease-related domain-containing protein [Neobacillus jeddahensis]|uniref:nuclease-related domain-containing protein n=1 Tax=Neobacillus jeddahensis TaxID=1461580 RepID=UPI000694A1B0|nr:nuclease-related domain-containing protein [Neobacillus jeddahensis]
MFAKPLVIPINLLKAEVLEKRTPKNHPNLLELKSFIKNVRSGYNGERKIHYYLCQIPAKRFCIFHDLRLPCGEGYFQIDALLLSPKGILMIDGKNHSGKLTIEKNQMIQEYADKRSVYENPISQANRHNLLLTYFLQKHKILQIPIDSLAVICKSSTELVISPGYLEAEKKVCRVSDLLRKIDKFYRYHNRDLLDQKSIEKIKRLLLKNHTPQNIDLFKKFDIAKLEIITGVPCPHCSSTTMTYGRRHWLCPICHYVSKDAHLEAINDYFLLINPSFTNSEIRTFLHLPSTRTTTYLLSQLNLSFKGSTKDRRYFPPDELPLSTNYLFPNKTNTKKNMKGEDG